MSILVVGGDFLGDMTQKLFENGATQVTHWSGRARQTVRKKIPKNTDMIVILTDYINHKLCKVIKSECRKTGCPVVYSKRSWSHLQGALKQSGLSPIDKGCSGCECEKKLPIR